MTFAFAACMLILAAAGLTAQEQVSPAGFPSVYDRLQEAPLSPTDRQAIEQAISSHDYKAAETKIVQAIDEHQPSSAKLLKLAAAVFMLDKNPMNTAIALKKAERIEALVPADRFLLSMAYISMGKGEWARPELTQLASSDEENPLYQYWLARIDYDGERYQNAVTRLEALTRRHPEFVKAWDNLGLALEGIGQLDEAIESYSKAVELNRKESAPSPWPPLNLGTLLEKLGRAKDAHDYIEEAVRYDGKLAEAQYRLGLILYKQHKDAEAIEKLRQASTLAPSDPKPFYILGRIYQKQGDKLAASDAFKKFAQLKKLQRGGPESLR